MKLLELKKIDNIYLIDIPSKYVNIDFQLWNNFKSRFYSILGLRKIQTRIDIIYSQVMLQMKRNIRIES